MPTLISHLAVPLALGLGLGRRHVPVRLWAAGGVAAVLPDLDVLAFHFHIPYAAEMGHRGLSHSLLAALVLAVLALCAAPWLRCTRGAAFAFVGVCAASHGLLDMCTNGGLGVALWWPLSTQRHFFPWHPIEVSPISVRQLLSGRGWMVLQSELRWVWAPALAAAALLWALRRLRQR